MKGSLAIPSPVLAIDGYAIVADLISQDQVASVIEAIGQGASTDLYARRNLLSIPQIRALANCPSIRRLIECELGVGAFPVRGLFFDKTADTNWKVGWHQDRSIAVKQRIDVPGYGPWSVKAGVLHVQPPSRVLENMVTLRIHLDDCGQDNGPLRVLAGSHATGILSNEMIAEWRRRATPIDCTCFEGGALLMRPLLLHASSQAALPRHRRVVHIEYATGALAGGLEWFED